ncbi:MAG: PAS domain-containing protein [Bacteroidetes bacterium]|nr:PAS domain-containing protein [Deltaproteobacteria bacterium]MBT4525948.1 PAS domain-containing protein [Deltaproteobacteria bacterium]MBT7039929.1 PAS domain-containing protein [Bacteroidota bacterium]
MEKVRILIVEDEAIIAMELESQLQSLGYEVTSIVDTGEKAIEKAEADKPDLILMDIRIKGEMDGIDTAEVIRNKFNIPVIFSTAYLDQKRIERAKITMPFGYVLKPIQERDLKVTLEMALYVTKVDTERKRVEARLKESERSKSTLISNLQGMAYRCENAKNWPFLFVSEGAKNLTGYSKDEFTKQKVFLNDLIVKEDREHVWETVQNAIVKDLPFVIEYRICTAEGKLKWVWEKGRKISSGDNQLIFLEGFISDITDFKEAEITLKLQSKLIDSIDQGIIATDLRGQVLFFNKFAEKLYQWNSAEVLKMNIMDVTVPQVNEQQGKEIMVDLAKGESWSGEFMVQRKDGTAFMAQISNFPIHDDDGKLIGIVGTSRKADK